MRIWLVRLTVASALMLTMGAVRASAEIIYLSSGRTISVKSHRIDGDTISFALRGGGEMSCPLALVRDIMPDEVPYPDPPAPPALASGALSAVPFADLIDAASTANGVDPQLVRVMIAVESAYQPRAVSPKGAMGLMQLMPATARQYSVTDPFDPKANIEAGVQHLKSLLGRFELGVALAAYNAGEAAVQRFGGVPPYRETRDYVSRVLTSLPRR